MKESFDALIDHLMNAGFFLEQAVEILEKGMIERALQSTDANQSEAAKMLGIHRNTLQRKMVEYKIDGKRPRRKPVSRAAGQRAGKPCAVRAKRRTAYMSALLIFDLDGTLIDSRLDLAHAVNATRAQAGRGPLPS